MSSSALRLSFRRLGGRSICESRKCTLNHNLRRNFITSAVLRHDGQNLSGKFVNPKQPEEEKPQQAQNRASGSGLKGLRGRNKKPVDNASLTSDALTILGQSTHLPIRARFAPSPTGYLHLGSLRTALFNKLAVSASNGGAFILRIEDTDQNRLVKDAEERLMKDLKWAGLTWDEGPDCGGPYGPYRQSERLPVYHEHVHKLLNHDHAYRCFCTPEQLESQKRELHEAGKPTIYPGTCRSIDSSESDRRAKAGESHVVRFKSDKFGRPKLRDAIYGPFQKKDMEEDFILMKTDGFPTYHLANVVDDHLMKITHVIRGEYRQEWLISTPKHVALYEAFGWQPPTFAHLGLLVDMDGSKLSKRNDSVNISKYQNGGVFPMALLTWLANLGSSFKRDVQPPRTVDDVANALTFKFTRGGIKLNLAKLEYFNSRYRDAMLWKPVPALADQEAKLIDQHLTQPILREIDAITNGSLESAELTARAWRLPLEIVPALTDSAKKAPYVHKALVSKQGGFQTPSDLISQHPYLFWRVPSDVYKTSLTKARPEQKVIDALEDAISHESYWDGDGTKVMQAIQLRVEPQGVDQLTIHNVLRVIAAGGQDVVSQSSSRMFMLLGRDEWAHRLDVVKGLLNDLEAN
ncbi:glutamyl-trna synthetase [Trichoderma arundinaceum]|uniref:Glutamate--tRNA ligase, mitochondrial n=1 Tax=Trichoderma arundinaceum TaxID=490622 RepID=A0A395NN76_TRIAR|nr:glutamyl-trna synthetase [Trichoderma arundinaceum]